MRSKLQMVVFKIGSEEFAIDIALAKEIVEMRPITPIPETLDYVMGVMNLRGNLVPVLDLRKRLRAGAEPGHVPQPETRIIIAKMDGKQMGLVVDSASEVVRATDEMIEAPPHVITEIGADYISGILNIAGRFITVLDLSRALKGDITHELDEVHRLMSSALSGERIQALAGN
jgi:purine-binding chemotaxis protein CheW